MRWTAENAECLVFTYKEGLLSKVAHDLKIRVTRFEGTLEDDSLEFTYDATSLRVICAMKRGVENPRALSASDRDTIDERTRDDVLHSGRFGSIRFVAKDLTRGPTQWTVAGELSLHGVTRALRATVRVDGDHLEARVRLHQPDYGITPYRAMLGALKVKADVDVVMRVPLPV